MFKIGDFSRLTQVTIKALRLYNRLGLLEPDHIDDASGYRYYTAAQVTRLDRILALKDLGFSLEQVGRLLDADLSPAQLHGMLVMKQGEVRDRIATEQERLTRIEARLRQTAQDEREASDAHAAVTLKRAAAQHVAALSAVLPNYPAVGALFGELQAYQRQHGLQATAWTAVWHDGAHREAEIHAEVSFTTPDPLPPHPRIQESELPAVAMMACVHHHGPSDTVREAHLALLRWIAANDYRLAGPTRTLPLPLPGPPGPDRIIEIQYPIARNGDTR